MNKKESNPIAEFQLECAANIAKYGNDTQWQMDSKQWLARAFSQKYMYNYSWMNRPIIQLPNDIVVMQEIIWKVKPDLIIETGIAHGGSLILSASMLALLDMCDAIESNTIMHPKKSNRMVLGVDIDIREHNRLAIQSHPMSSRISMMQGSSISNETIEAVHRFSKPYKNILVCLDSNHTHSHVLAELQAYAPLTTKNSYCVVFDTVVEDMPVDMFPDRPWAPGNNPKTAVKEYLKELQAEEIKANDGHRLEFEVDRNIEQKLLITVAPDGFLRRM